MIGIAAAAKRRDCNPVTAIGTADAHALAVLPYPGRVVAVDGQHEPYADDTTAREPRAAPSARQNRRR